MLSAEVRDELIRIAGARYVFDRPEDLRLYEYDGGVDKARPDAVVLPRGTEQVSAIARLAFRHGLPLVGRGAGTGLSGGTIPRHGGILIGFSRMNRILDVDYANERAVVEPGVVNFDLSAAVQPRGYFFAPDPSSGKACTLGGNVAENAGGPHTLAYGVTTNHVLGLEVVLADGSIVHTGAAWPDAPGYDLTGLLTGSEGTMALVTKVIVRLMHQAEAVKTVLAIYDRADDCAATVSEITARGITPAALEMLEGTLIHMVEDATHAGYPVDASGVLLIEMEGLKEAVEEQAERVRAACLACHAREFRTARTEQERALLWKGRKNAFGAIGRVSPFYYTQDGVVPRTKIGTTLREIGAISRRAELTIGNIFHAGDGNMHPVILFDARKPGDLERAQRAGFDILDYCISIGGSITGEHGIGMEKIEMIGHQFSPESLDLMRRIKQMFDPLGRLNPGKLLPTGRGCIEMRQPPLINPSQML